MVYKKLLCFLLFFSGTNTKHILAMDIPNNDRLKQAGSTLQIYPSDHSYIGIIAGGVLAATGLALIVYGKIQSDTWKDKLEELKLNNPEKTPISSHNFHETEQLLNKDKKEIEKNIEYYKNYYFGGSIAGILGAILLAWSFWNKYTNNKAPLLTLNRHGIESTDEAIAWNDLTRIQHAKHYHKAYSTRNHTIYHEGKPIVIQTPEETTYSEDYIEFVARQPNDYTLHIAGRDEGVIAVPVARLPISQNELIALVRDYQTRYRRPHRR